MNSITAPSLKKFPIETVIPIDECGSWKARDYYLDKKSAFALEMALTTQRPLLVKGEPGMGKSYLARAAASHLKRQFIAEVININTEGQDLLWQNDLIARLNDAQMGKDPKELGPKYYINPGALWWTFDFAGAKQYYRDICQHKTYCPQGIHDSLKQQHDSKQGVVLLIDEIDKADPSLPNSLLEVLDNGGFDLPLLGETIGKKPDQPSPLVIITTNDERELPPAFLRRCLVLHLKVDEDNIQAWLLKRANVHFTDSQCNQTIKIAAAEQLIQDRKQASKFGIVKSGLAEYLDLLSALNEMTEKNLIGDKRETYQKALLAEIQGFVLSKER